MLGLAAVPSLVLLVGMIFMPETPRHLVHVGEEDEAREVLEAIRGDERPDERDRGDPRGRAGGERRRPARRSASQWVRPALLVAIGLAVFQQLVGINTIIYYAPTTLTNVGFGKDSAIYANLVIGVVNVAMTVIAIRLVDRVGRKPLLLAGWPAWSPACSCSASRCRSCPSRTARATPRRSSRSSASPRSSPPSRPPGARSCG